RDAPAGRAAALPDPAGLPAVGDPPRLPAGRRRPRVRQFCPDRRLRGGAALPAGRAGAGRARQRAQPEDHLPRRPGHRRAAAQSLVSLALARLALIRPTRARPARARQSGYSAVSSSISVTRAAIGDRSDLVRVTCANSGWPFSFTITATT